MHSFAEFLYIDKETVNVQKLMRVLEALAKPDERAGDLRAQALVYTAIAGAYAETGQPVMVEWIIETLRFSRSRVFRRSDGTVSEGTDRARRQTGGRARGGTLSIGRTLDR